MGTFCQLCGLATQHDHYVQAARDGMPEPPPWKIYRGPDSHDWAPGERPFAFEPRHAWLCDAVAVMGDDGRVIRGRISDGAIVSADGDDDEWIGGGMDDGVVYHHACWERLGRPESEQAAKTTYGSYEQSFVEPYQRQLFDFHALSDDGRGWMLEDPRESARTAAHHDMLVDMVKARELRPKSDGRGLWHGVSRRSKTGGRDGIRRERVSISDEVRSEYPQAVWLDKVVPRKPYLRPELEAFERQIKPIIERDGRGLFVVADYFVDHVDLHWYAKDGHSSLKEILALPELDIVIDSSSEVRDDPGWQLYENRPRW
ncbi:MAG: hypothetical protein HOV80_32640 [Polyangiaceae bacterium]|nr:hypothetical protein [Polyangiaceae bacterium]